MAKFAGNVGFVSTEQTAPGVWEEVVTLRPLFGDVIRINRRVEPGIGLNDNLRLNNAISVVADAYAAENFFAIRFVDWMGVLWKITNVEVQSPRLILTIGEVYNGPKG